MQRKIQLVLDAKQEPVDYDAALPYVDQLDVLLPDSSRVARLRADIEATKQQVIDRPAAAIPPQRVARKTTAPSEAAPAAASTIDSSGSLSTAQRKQRLLSLAAATDLPEALSLLGALKAELPADDDFLHADAPNALAAMYIRFSTRAFERGEFESAAALLSRADEFTPGAPWIAARQESVDRLARLARTLDVGATLHPEVIETELAQVQASETQRYSIIRRQLAEILAQRIAELQSTAPQRANVLLGIAREIFPHSAPIDDLQTLDPQTIDQRDAAPPVQPAPNAVAAKSEQG